jgi:serine phosphatase RsbU (regulator of sigma subunit)
MRDGGMKNRWVAPCLVSVIAIFWLVWAFPRLHPATRLGLQFDRQGYIEAARRVAVSHGANVQEWPGRAEAETLLKNQELHQAMPADSVAKAFPEARVLASFQSSKGGPEAKITTRTDGRPLEWTLPPPEQKSAPSATAPVDKAMHLMTGGDSAKYIMTAAGVPMGDGMSYKWQRGETKVDSPGISVETIVRDGVVWQAKTDFRLPENTEKKLTSVPVVRLASGVIWFLILLFAMAIPVLREGSAGTARALKDRSAILISAGATAIVILTSLIEWDDEMIAVPQVSGIAMKVLGLTVAGIVVGLMFYPICAGTMLNARLHASRIRGFRLLGSRAFFSRLVGAEILGGMMLSPVIVGIPMAVAAVLRVPFFKGYEDNLLLSRFPVFNVLLNSVGQDSIAVAGLFGLFIPLALRISRSARMSRILIFVFALLTFGMLGSPFRGANVPNLAYASLVGLTMLWTYFRFGMLGGLAAHCSARIIVAAGAWLVQPSVALQTSGSAVLFVLAAIILMVLVIAAKGPEVVAELYGESGAKVQARSRREELLAEFNVARSAQQLMLPAKAPALEGYTLAASCDPAREVGGDLYDFLRLRNGRWGIGVADVSGKGVPAALYMTLTKGLLCAASEESDDPRLILGAVNKHLRTVTKKKMFVTMALGVLDPAMKRMEYVRAGHNPVVWRRHAAQETRLLSGTGIGLGIAGPALFARTLATETLELEPGDALVFYSDGLTEAMDAELEQFGEERLMAVVERSDGMDATATRDSILKEVKQFLKGGHSQDDLTIAVLRVNPATSSNGR